MFDFSKPRYLNVKIKQKKEYSPRIVFTQSVVCLTDTVFAHLLCFLSLSAFSENNWLILMTWYADCWTTDADKQG